MTSLSEDAMVFLQVPCVTIIGQVPFTGNRESALL